MDAISWIWVHFCKIQKLAATSTTTTAAVVVYSIFFFFRVYVGDVVLAFNFRICTLCQMWDILDFDLVWQMPFSAAHLTCVAICLQLDKHTLSSTTNRIIFVPCKNACNFIHSFSSFFYSTFSFSVRIWCSSFIACASGRKWWRRRRQWWWATTTSISTVIFLFKRKKRLTNRMQFIM